MQQTNGLAMHSSSANPSVCACRSHGFPAGSSFIRRWQQEQLQRKLEEAVQEEAVHAHLDNIEEVIKSTRSKNDHQTVIQAFKELTGVVNMFSGIV